MYRVINDPRHLRRKAPSAFVLTPVRPGGTSPYDVAARYKMAARRRDEMFACQRAQ